MSEQTRVLVTGAGGFIGSHLVTYLREKGYWVRGVDIKMPEFGPSDTDEFMLLDLRRWENCLKATEGIDEVYALAADMGGMGFISAHHAQILYNNSLINLHTLEAARENGVKRYLYTSSACIYPEYLQEETQVVPLKEEDAYPAMPQDAYGWEKLVSEILCHHYRNDYGIETRTVRFHNIFGEKGTWEGGREKAPAAMCRKIATAKITGDNVIEIWGDGEQTRSFCYINDCVEGIYRLMRSDFAEPLNLGQDRMVSINELADMVAKIAGVAIDKKHIDGPQGVRGRNSDNSKLRETLGWEPEISLEDGLAVTYAWIEDQVKLDLAEKRRISYRLTAGMSETRQKIAIVIPVYNRREITLQGLRSLARIDSSGLDIRTFIVDDGSTDNTSDAIAREFPDVTLIQGDGTLHYAAGTNRGIEKALEWEPDFIAAMNDDAVFHESFLQRLVSTAYANPRSIVGGLLLLWNEPHKVFQVGQVWHTIRGGWEIPEDWTAFNVSSEPFDVECIVGNCVLIPAAAIEEVGLMDEERFPHGWGDAQWMTRFSKNGWRLMIEPRSYIWCEPNTYPTPLHKMPAKDILRTLFVNTRHPLNLSRQFTARWRSAPTKPAAVVSFVIYLGHLVAKAASIVGRGGKSAS